MTKIYKYEKNRQTERTKTLFFASIAHDLKTPINCIMGTNHNMSAMYEDEQTKALLNMSYSSCHFLLSLIDDIFDYSKIELGHFSLEYSWIST